MPEGQLLLPRFVLPVRPKRQLLEGYAVRLSQGRIDAVLPRDEALQRFPSDALVSLANHVLLPGLINMHTHSPMVLLRGYADDMALAQWLEQHIWPAEQKWVSPEFVKAGTELAIAEMLRAGTTCFNEQYFFPDVIAAVAQQTGIRAVVAVPIIDVATPWARDLSDCLRHGRQLIADLRDSPLVSPALAPHAPYTVNDEGMKAVVELAGEHDLRINMHLLEASWEIGQSMDRYGQSPLQRLQRLGVLNERFVAVHMVHVSTNEMSALASSGVHVVHCPESNLKLASGMSPVANMLDAGINVSLGTDGAASNNNLDMLAELQTAALLAKGVANDPQALDAWQALDMVTINAASALGMHESLGTIEVGKQADLCALDLNQPETQPLHRVHSQLVYSASSRQFSDVWVAGRQLLRAGQLTTINLEAVLDQAQDWQARLSAGRPDEH